MYNEREGKIGVWGCWFCNLAEAAFIFIHVLSTCALNGGKGGELGVILVTDGRVFSLRGGTQGRTKLHVEAQDRRCKKKRRGEV